MSSTNARAALAAWPKLVDAELKPLGRGLINETWAAGDAHVLQRVNPIFGPRVHENIDAVCQHLSAHGFVTPMLERTGHGALCSGAGENCWRLLTRVAGTTHAHATSAAMVRDAAHLVGRWHACLASLDHEFVVLRAGVHDMQKHLATLHEAVAAHASHRLAADVEPLARRIVAATDQLPPLPETPQHNCHGDLKLDNIVFDGSEPVSLIDLDTVGPMSFAHELGDAWRSWCNPNAEDRADSSFDVDRFAAAWEGWRSGWGSALDEQERGALLLGPEWITLELSARFCADALNESYFGFDERAYPRAGEHNLSRARAQFAYFESVRAARARRAGVLGL